MRDAVKTTAETLVIETLRTSVSGRMKPLLGTFVGNIHSRTATAVTVTLKRRQKTVPGAEDNRPIRLDV